MANRVNHQDLVKKLIESKAVDFKAIGQAIGEVGPSAALADEPWEIFCGTMRGFIHLYRIREVGSPVENLGELQGIAKELRQ